MLNKLLASLPSHRRLLLLSAVISGALVNISALRENFPLELPKHCLSIDEVISVLLP